MGKKDIYLLIGLLLMFFDQATEREKLYSLLGDLPERTRPLSARKLFDKADQFLIIEKWELDLNGIESVPAYFTKPRHFPPPFPAILYNHAHGGDYQLGKDELIRGRAILQQPPYAEALARQGIAALCIDSWAFGERSGKSESSLFKEMLWDGRVLWGMMVYDNLRALDFLVAREDVDASRLGTLGMSMGSTMAYWLAALDTRIKVCVDICCLTDFQTLRDLNRLDAHGLYFYVPGLLKHFSAAQINALIAPRAHLSLIGTQDKLTPLEGTLKVDAELREIYRREGAPENWRLMQYNVGHFETADMRREILQFLERFKEQSQDEQTP